MKKKLNRWVAWIVIFSLLWSQATLAGTTELTGPPRFLRQNQDIPAGAVFDSYPAAVFFAQSMESLFILFNAFALVDKEDLTPEEKSEKKRALAKLAAKTIFAGTVVDLAVGIPLVLSGTPSSQAGTNIAQGLSRTIASILVAKLSVDIPVMTDLLQRPLPQETRLSKCIASTQIGPMIQKVKKTLFSTEMGFLVAVNLFRQTLELGFFVIPLAMTHQAQAVPLSAAVGLGSSLMMTAGYQCWGKRMNKKTLGAFASTVTGLLSAGLFSGAMHSLENATEAPSATAYSLADNQTSFWSDASFPMAFAAPFGYADSPTVVQIVSWWVFATSVVIAHLLQIHNSVGVAPLAPPILPVEATTEEPPRDLEANIEAAPSRETRGWELVPE